MRSCLWVLVGAWAGCAKEEPASEPDAPIGECGTPTYGIEMTFVGVAETPSGARVADATIELEDRQFQPPTILGTATSDAEGTWQMDASEISSWPDCWLTLLDYRIVGSKDDFSGEMEVNRFMWESIQDDSYAVDLTTRPLVLRPPE